MNRFPTMPQHTPAGGFFDQLIGRTPKSRATGGLLGALQTLDGDEGEESNGNPTTCPGGPKGGFKDLSDDFAGLAEWILYIEFVRNNEKLTYAEKAEKARDYVINFEAKCLGYYKKAAERDAEEYERLAQEEAQKQREAIPPTIRRPDPGEEEKIPPYLRRPDEED